MGMSTHIKAFVPDTDKDFQKHKKILLMCSESEVSLPKETMDYFGVRSDYPDKTLLEEKLQIDLQEDIHYEEYSRESSAGFEVDLTKLPKGVTKIRFYNSW